MVFDKRHDRQQSGPSGISHTGLRKDRKAEADLDGALYRLDIVEFSDLFHLDAILLEDPIDGLSRRYITLEMHEILAFDIACTEAFAAGELVVGRCDQDHSVLGHMGYREASARLREGQHA